MSDAAFLLCGLAGGEKSWESTYEGTTMELVLLLGGIAVGAVVLVIGLLVLIASLGAIQDWLSGVNGHRRALVARGVSPVLADAIAHELGLAQGGLAFALIGVVFGVPVLALGG